MHDNEKRKVELRLNHVEELMSVGHPFPPHGGAMSEIRVKCYAGYGADERPLRFTLRDKEFEV
jgi:hypothetical protein